MNIFGILKSQNSLKLYSKMHQIASLTLFGIGSFMRYTTKAGVLSDPTAFQKLSGILQQKLVHR